MTNLITVSTFDQANIALVALSPCYTDDGTQIEPGPIEFEGSDVAPLIKAMKETRLLEKLVAGGFGFQRFVRPVDGKAAFRAFTQPVIGEEIVRLAPSSEHDKALIRSWPQGQDAYVAVEFVIADMADADHRDRAPRGTSRLTRDS
ncbi:hypothetical protein [Paracoccus laeviglucosivorans]|uniref:Uncharacterized protein n=1 Tax=Paracoccus laeviglucosivorans TaxID=1197861 RepID=A0A521FCF5_9RHOB|nr:hypothetical protein [Paracoccus laeviglucosivorans]SMO93853.1 hypothetical protein SAMN06265221_12040 [Paracoccus laeviglucosivorans]